MSELEKTPEELGFDPDALREKYRVERDKRLRGDGNEQYLFRFLLDPGQGQDPGEHELDRRHQQQRSGRGG